MDTSASSDLPHGSRLVAYLRDSGGRDQNLSVPQQQAAVVDWCKANNHILVRVFADVARTGTKLAGRDQFAEMCAHLESSPDIQGVIFWEYARLSRDYDDLLYYVSDWRRQGYAVISITDNVPVGLDGRLMEAVVAWKNARYSEDLRKNIKRGQRYIMTVHKAKPGGRPPMGYRFRKVEIGKRRDGTPHLVNKMEPDPRYAPLVRKAFEMRAAGATYNEIDAETRLFDWNVTYNKMLRNPVYTGHYEYGGVVVEDFCPPIVDAQLWQAVQNVNAQRAEQSGINHPRTVRSRFYLSGLLFCAICGRPMNGRVAHQRKPYTKTTLYYRCNSQSATVGRCGASVIRKDAIEARVLSAVKLMLTTPDVMADIYRQLQDSAEETMATRDAVLENCRADLGEVRRSIARLVSAIKDAGHSPAILSELAALEVQERELDERLRELEALPPVAPDVDITALSGEILEALDAAGDKEKGLILRGFIKRIVAQRTGMRRDGAIVGEIECYAPGTSETFVVPL